MNFSATPIYWPENPNKCLISATEYYEGVQYPRQNPEYIQNDYYGEYQDQGYYGQELQNYSYYGNPEPKMQQIHNGYSNGQQQQQYQDHDYYGYPNAGNNSSLSYNSYDGYSGNYYQDHYQTHSPVPAPYQSQPHVPVLDQTHAQYPTEGYEHGKYYQYYNYGYDYSKSKQNSQNSQRDVNGYCYNNVDITHDYQGENGDYNYYYNNNPEENMKTYAIEGHLTTREKLKFNTAYDNSTINTGKNYTMNNVVEEQPPKDVADVKTSLGPDNVIYRPKDVTNIKACFNSSNRYITKNYCGSKPDSSNPKAKGQLDD